MSVETTSQERQGFYLLKQIDDVATLKLGNNFLSNTIDLAVKNSLFDVFDHISDNGEIKVLVIMNCHEQIGCEGYIDFCRQVLDTEFDRKSIQRMCNVFDQLILKIVRLNKPIIYADCGFGAGSAGRGLKTFIVQFMKNSPYGEIKILEQMPNWVTLEYYGNDSFVFSNKAAGETDIYMAQQALHRARKAMSSNKYDIVIMDEVCAALFFVLLKTQDVLSLLEEKPGNIELILTGRYCPPELIEKADLVTEMQEIKHYYQKGVAARKGIES